MCGLAIGADGWLRHHATFLERLVAVAAGLLLLYPAAISDLAGTGVFAMMAALHLWRTREIRQ